MKPVADATSAIVDMNGDTKAMPPDNLGLEDDPWALSDIYEQDSGPRWTDLSLWERTRRVLLGIGKGVALLGLLWSFVCSLDLLSTSFRLSAGKQAGAVFQESELLRNPVVGLMIGVLSTVLVQSSSTSTSIIVTMVGTGLLTVSNAVPIVMGANIGTSVTNTVVSLGQMNDRREFRRAFAAATIHDMFNWLSVIVLLPIEVFTGYLEHLTNAIMDGFDWTNVEGTQKHSFLQTLTKPVTSLIVQLDKKLLTSLASGLSNKTDVSLLKKCFNNETNQTSCGYLLERIPGSDLTLGLCLLVCSVALLILCLCLIVKLLKSMMGGPIASLLQRVINAEPPMPWAMFTGYFAMLLGCVLTIVVQSSSVFTSTLTPLAGVGIVSLERIYPLTLGSNIGTTTTGLLAAFASPPASQRNTLQIAFCHLFFNLSGILLFYPIPATRLPIPLAKILGSTTAEYRWFSVFYLLLMFIILPFAIFSLSMAGTVAFVLVGAPIFLFFVLVIIINVIQNKRPFLLPFWLRDWSFLPECLRSLDPVDRLLTKVCFCCAVSGGRRDAPALGLVPNQSQINILQPCSTSSSTLTLNSTFAPEYHTMNGFENCAFGNLTPKKKPGPTNNNDIIDTEWDFGGTTTAL